MNDLLVLRLGLLAVIFVFAFAVAITMRGGMTAGRVSRQRSVSGRAPRLVVIAAGTTGIRKGTEFVLAGEMSIGRDGSNSIVLDDSSVSAEHAVLVPSARGWQVNDVGSTNGTFVNGRELGTRPVPLRGNEDIAFGSVVTRFLR